MKLGQKGFTIVEILITVFLLAVGVVGVQKSYNVGMKAGIDIENVEIAMNLAQSKMAEVRNTGFASLADSGPAADADFPSFYVTVDVDDGENPMQVDVTVSWTYGGEQGSFVLTTLVADY